MQSNRDVLRHDECAWSKQLFRPESGIQAGWIGCSGQDVVQHVSVHVGQPVVTSGVTIGELLVIEAHEVKDRGMEIVDMDAVVSENSITAWIFDGQPVG